MNMLKRFSLLLAPLLILLAVFAPLPATTTPVLAKEYDSKYFKECNAGGSMRKAGENQNICTARLIFSWAAMGATTVITIMIVIGAILYMLSGDNQEKAKKAISIIKSAILGLILFLIMYAIIDFLIPGGIR